MPLFQSYRGPALCRTAESSRLARGVAWLGARVAWAPPAAGPVLGLGPIIRRAFACGRPAAGGIPHPIGAAGHLPNERRPAADQQGHLKQRVPGCNTPEGCYPCFRAGGSRGVLPGLPPAPAGPAGASRGAEGCALGTPVPGPLGLPFSSGFFRSVQKVGHFGLDFPGVLWYSCSWKAAPLLWGPPGIGVQGVAKRLCRKTGPFLFARFHLPGCFCWP